ncbi:hypothetical protein SUGI_0440670 [Cryptomeria japonica]|nr:hypothetical protein SUGI_0440670 [Cryptomeria japonica]
MWSHLFKYLDINRPTPTWTTSDDSVKRYVTEAGNELAIKLFMAANDNGNACDGWKPLKNIVEDVQIFKKDNTLRGTRTLNVPLSAFKEQVNTVNTAKLWDGKLVEGSQLQDFGEKVDVVFLAFSQFAEEAILRSREFVVLEMRQAIKDQIYVVGCSSLPKWLSRAVLAENKKRLRGKIELGWVFQMLEDNKSCKVTCFLQLNPGGWMPKCCVKKQQSKLLTVMMNQMFTLAVDKWLENHRQ